MDSPNAMQNSSTGMLERPACPLGCGLRTRPDDRPGNIHTSAPNAAVSEKHIEDKGFGPVGPRCRSARNSKTKVTNAIVLANSSGQFTGSSGRQPGPTRAGGAFKWSTKNSNIFVGDFNGDGKKDLLVQALPKFVIIDYDVQIPVPTYC